MELNKMLRRSSMRQLYWIYQLFPGWIMSRTTNSRGFSFASCLPAQIFVNPIHEWNFIDGRFSPCSRPLERLLLRIKIAPYPHLHRFWPTRQERYASLRSDTVLYTYDVRDNLCSKPSPGRLSAICVPVLMDEDERSRCVGITWCPAKLHVTGQQLMKEWLRIWICCRCIWFSCWCNSYVSSCLKDALRLLLRYTGSKYSV